MEGLERMRSIEEQIKEIVKGELKAQLEEIEARFQRLIEEELQKIGGQLSDIDTRIEKIEAASNNKWNTLLKLKRYTLDQLMSEYRNFADAMWPEREQTEETAEE